MHLGHAALAAAYYCLVGAPGGGGGRAVGEKDYRCLQTLGGMDGQYSNAARGRSFRTFIRCVVILSLQNSQALKKGG